MFRVTPQEKHRRRVAWCDPKGHDTTGRARLAGASSMVEQRIQDPSVAGSNPALNAKTRPRSEPKVA